MKRRWTDRNGALRLGLVLAGLSALGAACGGDAVDSGGTDGGGSDAGDGGVGDGGTGDAGAGDGGAGDGGADGGSGDGGSGDGGTDDCTVPDDPTAVFGSVQHEVDEVVRTVVHVRWHPPDDRLGQVRVERDGQVLWSADGDAVDDGVLASVVGLKPATTYRVRVVLDDDGTLLCTDPIDVTTGTLPPGLPLLDVDLRHAAAATDDWLLVPVINSLEAGPGWALVLDADGDVVWYHDRETLRMRRSLDGRAMLLNDLVYDPAQNSVLRLVPLDGSPTVRITVLGMHTDFVEVAPGVYGTFGWDIRPSDDGTRQFAADTLIEVRADGSITEIWNPFDDLTPHLDETYDKGLASYPDAELWTHLNHLHYEPSEDAYYISSRSRGSIHRVDRATGRLDWTLAVRDGDFSPVGDTSLNFNPHSAEPTDDGLLIFDTGSETTGHCSAISEFVLDTTAWTAQTTWQYATEDCLVTTYMGNATVLPDGNRLLVLALSGQLDEVTPDGDLARRITLPYGWWVSYASGVATIQP